MSTHCPYNHASRTFGEWMIPTTSEIGVVVTANGGVQYKARCIGCGNSDAILPVRFIKQYLSDGGTFAWYRANPPKETQPCAHRDCSRPGEEWHHFAPRNTFGIEADDWPVELLCKGHHREWHNRMDGYRTHRPRTTELESARIGREIIESAQELLSDLRWAD